MKATPWQLVLYRKSIKKKEKLHLILESLPEQPRRVALDLGCAQGLLSYFFRQKKGFWVSVDEDMANLWEARALLGSNLVQIESGLLPFAAEVFDLIICPDYLEHIERDDLCLEEITRTLKRSGELILVTPHTGPGHFLHRLRSMAGLKPEVYGHKREGYNFQELEARLKSVGLVPYRRVITSRIFSEGLELLLNLIYVRFFRRTKGRRLRDGHIRPMNAAEFAAQGASFRLYSLIYPLFWLASRLDSLIPFTPGYLLLIWAKKP